MKEENKIEVTTSEMRQNLKSIVQSEIENLPELLSKIENPEKRLNFVLKLLPFIFPKIKNIYQSEGETMEMTFGKCNGY